MSRVAVVTGGASGVGLAICEHLASAGALRRDGHRAHAAQVDISDREAIASAYEEVRAELGPIEILVTSAAMAAFVPFDEYAARGITANTVPPFMVDTGYLPEDKYLTRMVPAGRMATGDDIAATCAFLCSDAAGYLTGQVIAVNGGAIT